MESSRGEDKPIVDLNQLGKIVDVLAQDYFKVMMDQYSDKIAVKNDREK